MPGLLGIIQKGTAPDLECEMKALFAEMSSRPDLPCEMQLSADGRRGLGRVHLGVMQPARQLERNEEVQVLFHGDLANEVALRQELDSEHPSAEINGVVPIIRMLYSAHRCRFPKFLTGAFCGALLDEKRQQLLLFTDRLGSYPLYWFNGSQRFVFGSTLKVILCGPASQFALEPRAVADYVTFGFLFGDKTLASDVWLVPPASVLVYSWRDGSCAVEPYDRIEDFFQSGADTRGEYLEKLSDAFAEAVCRATSGDNTFGISLSGGLDSRAILSAIDNAQTPVTSYTLGVKGCADEVIAARLARIAGTEHCFVELDRRYLTEGVENLRRMIRLSDGMYLTHGLTEMLALSFLEQAGLDVLLRGHGAELAKTDLAWPLHTDENIRGMQGAEEFASYMLQRVNYISGKVPPAEIFTSDWAACVEAGPRLSLEESLAHVRLGPVDLCSYLYLKEHHRRFTVASLELFRSIVEVRMPFVDEDFLRVLCGCPADLRSGTAIHRGIIGRNLPELLKVRNSNTGAPAGAGPIAEKLLDKLNSLFMRLNIRGYRHYHSFERWMRRNLLASVEAVLLQPESLERGIVRESGLRRLIGETRAGVADHAYLLQILLTLELWQRDYL